MQTNEKIQKWSKRSSKITWCVYIATKPAWIVKMSSSKTQKYKLNFRNGFVGTLPIH